MTTLLDFYERHPERFDAYLFDIDGTLLLSNTPIPGADVMLTRLRADGVPFRFLTNNASQTHAEMSSRLRRAGIEAEPDDFVSSADCVADYQRARNRTGTEQVFFLIGQADDTPGAVRYEKDFEKIMDCDGILFNGGPHDWRISLTKVLNYFIAFPDRPFLIPNPDRLNPLPGGVVSVCPCGQAQLILRMLEEYGIRKEPVHFGKPYPPIYRKAMERLALPNGTPPERIMAAGDLLSSDILGANRAGMTSAVVLTGLTDRRTAENQTGEMKPDFIFDGL